jgi:UDP-N-acetylmuramate dehydrogenase
MVIDPSDPNSRSVGSFFKNPVIPAAHLERVTRAAGTETVPNFSAGDDIVKLPAAWLIENSGFKKGHKLGRAGISSNHSLALINLGGAAAVDILRLKSLIQDAVTAKFGILLEPEPIFVGF